MSIQGQGAEASALPAPLHLVEEISHRVVNEYAEAIGSLTLAAAGSADPRAREAIAGAADRLHAYAAMHRALLPPATDGVADLAAYVGQVCASFARASLAGKGVQIMVEADEVWLPSDQCWRIGLIVAELVRNAARHGLSGRHGAIHVRIMERSGRVTCVVCDNGRAGVDPAPGRGHRLVRSLAADLGGSVEWRFTPLGALAGVEFQKADDPPTAVSPSVTLG